MAAPGSFPPALTGLCIARQNNRASPSSAALRPFRSAPGAGPVRPPSFVAMKAAAVAVDPTREHPMSTDHDDTGFEPEHASSPTDHVLSRSEEHTSELQSLMRISYAVFCLKKNKKNKH